jgi:hypothetical protein
VKPVRFSIKAKLALTFGLVLALMAGSATFALRDLGDMNQRVGALIEGRRSAS